MTFCFSHSLKNEHKNQQDSQLFEMSCDVTVFHFLTQTFSFIQTQNIHNAYVLLPVGGAMTKSIPACRCPQASIHITTCQIWRRLDYVSPSHYNFLFLSSETCTAGESVDLKQRLSVSGMFPSEAKKRFTPHTPQCLPFITENRRMHE